MLFGSLSLATLLGRVIALLIAFTVHECAHAWAANELGDPTAKYQGRLTLNPLVHLDPLGTLMVLISGFGWAKPVPVNAHRLRNGPKMGMTIVSAAGPLSNLATAMVFAIPFRLAPQLFLTSGRFLPTLGDLLLSIVWLNIVLAVFNLIPLAPLDGFAVAVGLLPPRWSYELARYEQYGPMILMLVIGLGFIGPFDLLGLIMGPPITLLARLILGW